MKSQAGLHLWLDFLCWERSGTVKWEWKSLGFARGTNSSTWSLSITPRFRKCMLELAQKEALRLLAQLGVRLEGVLPQRERTQVEQGQELRVLREELDEVSTTYVPLVSKQASISLLQRALFFPSKDKTRFQR